RPFLIGNLVSPDNLARAALRILAQSAAFLLRRRAAAAASLKEQGGRAEQAKEKNGGQRGEYRQGKPAHSNLRKQGRCRSVATESRSRKPRPAPMNGSPARWTSPDAPIPTYKMPMTMAAQDGNVAS